MKRLLLFLAFAPAVVLAQEGTERLRLPFGTGVMTCGTPDPRETRKDGTYTCTNHYKPSVPNAKFTLKNGKLDGRAFGYTEDGEPAYEGTFKNGLEDGEVKTRYSKERKRFEKTTRYKAGKREGVETEYGYSDNIFVRLYKNDQVSGFTYNIKNGRIDSLGDCELAGQRLENEKCAGYVIPGYESQWKVWEKEQAEKAAKQEADRNREVVRKNREGVVIERYKLTNAQITGLHERFFNDGKPYLISEEKASRRIWEKEYFENGQLKRHSVYSTEGAGVEMKHDEFYQNGKPKLSWSRTLNSDGDSQIPFKSYFDNGKLNVEGVKVANRFVGRSDPMNLPYDGEIKFYDEKGNLIATETYSDRKRNGLMRELSYNKNKKPIVFESTYKDGVLLKTVTVDKATKKTIRVQEFMPDGSLKSDSNPDEKSESSGDSL